MTNKKSQNPNPDTQIPTINPGYLVFWGCSIRPSFHASFPERMTKIISSNKSEVVDLISVSKNTGACNVNIARGSQPYKVVVQLQIIENQLEMPKPQTKHGMRMATLWA